MSPRSLARELYGLALRSLGILFIWYGTVTASDVFGDVPQATKHSYILTALVYLPLGISLTFLADYVVHLSYRPRFDNRVRDLVPPSDVEHSPSGLPS